MGNDIRCKVWFGDGLASGYATVTYPTDDGIIEALNINNDNKSNSIRNELLCNGVMIKIMPWDSNGWVKIVKQREVCYVLFSIIICYY